MTHEDKQLLLKDLSARLPYGVICKIKNKDNEERIVDLTYGNINYVFTLGDWWKECKPYLRPMPSMNEEERGEIEQIARETRINPDGVINNKGMDNLLLSVCKASEVILDYLNAHHFDYRGLIEKGIALETPK